MRWTNEQLEKRIKIYNRIYFNNEIKKPIVFRWSKHLYNTGSSTEAYCQSYKDYHLITYIRNKFGLYHMVTDDDIIIEN